MSLKDYLLYFLTGGIVTTVIVALENSSQRMLSGLATLIPVFTLIAYFFIGESRGGIAVSQHAWLVLIGTIVSWIPYMIIVAVLAPKLGPHKAIAFGLITFFALATVYLILINFLGLFRASS